MRKEAWYSSGSTELLLVGGVDVSGKFGLDVMGMNIADSPRRAARVCFGECPDDMELTTRDLLGALWEAKQALDGAADGKIITPSQIKEAARCLWIARLAFGQEPGDWALTDATTYLALSMPGKREEFDVREVPATRIETELTPFYAERTPRCYPAWLNSLPDESNLSGPRNVTSWANPEYL